MSNKPMKKQPGEELLAEIRESGIHMAEYLTVLPEKTLLEEKLHHAITKARLRFGLSKSTSLSSKSDPKNRPSNRGDVS